MRALITIINQLLLLLKIQFQSYEYYRTFWLALIYEYGFGNQIKNCHRNVLSMQENIFLKTCSETFDTFCGILIFKSLKVNAYVNFIIDI